MPFGLSSEKIRDLKSVSPFSPYGEGIRDVITPKTTNVIFHG